MSQAIADQDVDVHDQKVEQSKQRPPWKAKSVWLAAAVVVVGIVLWVADAKKPAPAQRAGSGSLPGMTSFGESSGGGTATAPEQRLEPTTPATFRLGVSYLGGFFIGWAFRKFIKLTLLLGGGIVALIAFGKYMGWFDVDWAAVQGHIQHSLSWLHGEAGAFKDFLTGYLPSAGTAVVGGVMGFRR